MKKGYPEIHPLFTYAMQCGTSVKVGRTTNVPLRLRQIQCSNPVPVFLLGVVERDIERSVHLKLQNNGVRRIIGEWFDFDESAKGVLSTEGLISRFGGFASWLPTQAFRDDRVGDFARDVQRDKDWPPAEQTKTKIRAHLRSKGACSDAIRAFAAAWKEWSAE